MAATDGRLTTALVRAERGAEPVSTPVDEAVARGRPPLKAIVEQYGPDAVALYVSGRCHWGPVSGHQAGQGLSAHRAHRIQLPAVHGERGTGYKQSLGSDGPPGSYNDFDSADLLFVIGANMADCHPILFLRWPTGSRRVPS
jgi:anaerobic selenocysteine-containing dehydrogenase